MGLHQTQPLNLIDQADRALYLSKAMGRDRVTHSGSLSDLAVGPLVAGTSGFDERSKWRL